MNRIVLITGGSSGYGLATAKKFADNNDTVIIVARNEEKLKKAVEESGAVASRGASFSHLALSSVRLIRTILSLGEGVGEYISKKIK